jgi:DNA repair exonuclease SbcCD ATPase subunit
MLFSFGDIVTLVVVLLVLIIYRALDRNNRSLEKLKRFSDKMTENLAALVQEKTAQVRDLNLEIQDGLKTGKEILARARGVVELLQTRSTDVEDIEKRFTDYDKALAELTNMSARVDKNLQRLRDESAFVDALGRRIEESGARLQSMEQRLPEVEEGFAARATEAFSALKEKMIGALDKRVVSLSSTVQATEAKVKDFSTYIARLESREEQTGKERLAVYAKALDAFDVDLRGRLSEAARRSETLEDEVFSRLSARIQSDEASLAKSMETIEQRISDYQGDAEYRVKSLEESVVDVDALRASLADTVQSVGAGVRAEMKSLSAELVAGWTAEVSAAAAAREQLRAGLAEIDGSVSALRGAVAREMDDVRGSTERDLESTRAAVSTGMDAMNARSPPAW